MNKLLTLLFLSITFSAHAQTIQSRQYPNDFFKYPLDLPPSTAGSFGELRPNHFHSGLDFKTNQRTGYPVHAVAVGYISRLRVQFGGFGNAVYITHPNGFTSVYGHLQSFSPEIARAVRQAQYDQQKYDVDFPVGPLLMPVNQGQVIAMSGNTGASAGPHLHFELRDAATEQTINPQLFGLTIPDKVPPTITAAVVYQLGDKPFSENTPHKLFAVAGSAGNYRLTKPQVIEVSGNTGFGISTVDVNSTSANKNGAYSIELKVDGRTVYTFAVERFAFDQTHAINAYVDYPTYLREGRQIQKCFIMPGSTITLYPQSENRGIVTFNDIATHDVEYVVKDIAGNTSTLKVKVRSVIKPSVADVPLKGTLFKYDKKNNFTTDKVKVSIAPGNLYDDVDFIYSLLPKREGAYSATHRIHNKFTPIHEDFELWIKPDVDMGALLGKAVIVNTAGYCDSTTTDGAFLKATPRAFGDYYIRVDTVAPNITPINIKEGSNLAAVKRVSFRISDNLSGIKSYKGYIDGKWVLMEWDYKTRVLSYTFDDSVAAGKHQFELNVSDYKNNTKQFKAEFYR
ncbi:M23 family metallopeptidase [Mucilaginibacter calamicampi]|uniref:M23 family metallopeptidase n=1 Tax=Mucilaginibacter calamicampi TaxID=1302352 RepID=A0ABW2YYA3_9SPHI